MKDPLEIRSDDSSESWLDFLREVEERCVAIANGEVRPEPATANDPWTTENGDPIDPVAFFVTFTGIE